MIELAIAGTGLYAAGFPNAQAWESRIPDPEKPAPAGTLIDKRTRRRTSPLTRALADAYGEALEQAQLDPSAVGSVFGSALGEATTMIALLDQMWRGDGALSPMRFATSVHNAAAGVVSITTKNRGFTTSLGADRDTPAMALFEAIAFAATHGEAVMVACGDEGSPDDLVLGEDGGWDLLACAVALIPADIAPANLPRLRGPFPGTPNLSPCDAPTKLAHNPVAGLLELVDAVRAARRGTLRLDRGRGRGFCVELVD